ncbi:hypothetical protein UQ07_03160 [Escherichia coli]|nr:hypothetical protein UQ07_03160 [Escherichia coli]
MEKKKKKGQVKSLGFFFFFLLAVNRSLGRKNPRGGVLNVASNGRGGGGQDARHKLPGIGDRKLDS